MKDKWNQRYAEPEFAYGTYPNLFFKESLNKYQPTGDILMAADGESRNGVFAAKTGLSVYSFDISEEARNKALQLASEEKVSLHYEVGDFMELSVSRKSYDAAGLIYAHFPPHLISPYHQKIDQLIKPGGLVILEAFSKNHLPLRTQNPSVGGPDRLDLLFDIPSIKRDFSDFEPLVLEEVEIELQEGKYHNGKGKVIRFVGRKLG